jgi:hypothetical protein
LGLKIGAEAGIFGPSALFFLTFCQFRRSAAGPGELFLAGSGAFPYIAARLRLPDISL